MAKRRKTVINRHHITYEPEWVVPIQMSWHRVISRIQHSLAKPELYALLINLQHSLNFEVNRIASDLQTGLDTRVKKPKKGE